MYFKYSTLSHCYAIDCSNCYGFVYITELNQCIRSQTSGLRACAVSHFASTFCPTSQSISSWLRMHRPPYSIALSQDIECGFGRSGDVAMMPTEDATSRHYLSGCISQYTVRGLSSFNANISPSLYLDTRVGHPLSPGLMDPTLSRSRWTGRTDFRNQLTVKASYYAWSKGSVFCTLMRGIEAIYSSYIQTY